MPMKNPPHPGGLVRDNLADLGLSVADGAAGLGITRQQLYKVINGQSSITPEMALRLEKAFGGSADVWLRMQVNYDLALVRRREKEIAVTRLAPPYIVRRAQSIHHPIDFVKLHVVPALGYISDDIFDPLLWSHRYPPFLPSYV